MVLHIRADKDESKPHTGFREGGMIRWISIGTGSLIQLQQYSSHGRAFLNVRR